MAFTASIRPRVHVRLGEISANPTLVDGRYFQDPIAGKALISRQTTRSEQILKSGACTGIAAWFYDPGDGARDIYEGRVIDPAINCTVPTATEGQTQSKNFDNNIFFTAKRSVASSRCDNDLTLAEETSRSLFDAMYELRSSAQKIMIADLKAVAQQNLSVPLPSYITERAATNILQIDPNNIVGDLALSTLLDLRRISNQNSLVNPFYLSGQNLQNSRDLAFLQAGTFSSQGTDHRVYDAFMNEIVFDNHNLVGLDKLAGGTDTNLTLAVSPSSYLFWNFTVHPEIPVMLDSSKNMWGFSVSDPYWMWNNNGAMVPVRYDVEVFHECTGYDSAGNRIDEITYRVWLKGGFVTMPAGYLRDGVTQGYTGVLHYTAI